MAGKKKDLVPQNLLLPTHIGIIMDGNGRWAKKRGLPRTAGHTAGAANFRTMVKYAAKIGIQHLTVYAFSTENWGRPTEEVSKLMLLFKEYLHEALRDFLKVNIKIRLIGDLSRFSQDLKDLFAEVELASATQTGMVLNIAMNYGGRAEITRACNQLAEKVKAGTISTITEHDIEQELYTAGQPDPDLIIRPSGEQRISNFMLWQSAYTEFVYFDILWPDFKTKHLHEAIEIFWGRKRRFGGV